MRLRLRYSGWFIVVLLLAAACSSSNTPSASPIPPTLRGAIIPTRITATPSDTPTATEIPSETPTATATDTETPIPSATATTTDQPTATDVPTDTATVTPSPTATDLPTATATDTPTEQPSATLTPTSSAAVLPPITSLFNPTLAERVSIGTSVSNRIDNERFAVLFTFNGTEGQVINVSMQRSADSLDPFLLMLAQDGHEIARNDDEPGGTLNALISGLSLPENGDYTIVASRYLQQFGSSSGGFTLSVTLNNASLRKNGTFSRPIDYNSAANGSIGGEEFEQIYTFAGHGGDVVNIRMTKTSGDLDSILILTDNLGNILTRNDDDRISGTIDSFISGYLLPADGFYSIIATRYQTTTGESSGNFRLDLTLQESGLVNQRFAVLDISRSGTLGSDGSLYVDYVAGDGTNDNNEEVGLQTFVTFYLPTMASGQQVTNAALDFGLCIENGMGFQGLGSFTVYADNYGTLTADTPQQPAAGAVSLGKLRDCLPIDVTALVQAAYQNGVNSFQVRVAFEDIIRNSQHDNVVFSDPRLMITRSA